MEESMKTITYCYLDSKNKEQVGYMTNENRVQNVGYNIDALTARIWISGDTGKETFVIPIDRLIFIREVITGVDV